MKLQISKKIFNPHFLSLLEDNEHTVMLLLGGASSGKSYFVSQRIIYRCLVDKRKVLVLRKSATDMERSCWADLMGTLDRWKIASKVKINKSLKTIEFPNGSQILAMGIDNQEKIKSIPAINDIWIEECSECIYDDFFQVKMRMRGTGKLKNQCMLSTNPISKVSWVFHHFFEDGCKEEDCIIDRSTYKDNPFTNETTIKALESYKDTNPLYYQVYCLGEFGSLGKRVYNNWRVEDLPIADLVKKGYQSMVGLDFGFVNDPTAITVSLLDDQNKKIYIINEFYETGLTNPEIVQQIEKMGLMKSVIIADSAEAKSIEEIKRLGVRRIKESIKGQGSVLAGIQKLQEYELIVDSGCSFIVEELENYSWKKDKQTNEYYNEPEDKNNHLMDALRYSLQCVNLAQPLKTMPKSILGL